jgi:hypothetical protein
MADPEFEAPAEPELLSLGLIGGGPAPGNELLSEAFMALMRWVRDNRGRYPNTGLRINIVFQIPGPFLSPDFEGVFPARYARKTNHLLVNAAVPKGLALDQVREFFVQALTEVRTTTLEYLQRRKIEVDTTHVMAFINDLVSERDRHEAD